MDIPRQLRPPTLFSMEILESHYLGRSILNREPPRGPRRYSCTRCAGTPCSVIFRFKVRQIPYRQRRRRLSTPNAPNPLSPKLQLSWPASSSQKQQYHIVLTPRLLLMIFTSMQTSLAPFLPAYLREWPTEKCLAATATTTTTIFRSRTTCTR